MNSFQYDSLPRRIENSLKTLLENRVPATKAREIYNYALFPAGKLFRPLLAYSLALDTSPKIWEDKPVWHGLTNLDLFTSALEIHHVYTLCHDDLPCMDDDDIRRGRPSVHKAYNEWKALLIGDGLLNLSYEALFHLDHPHGKRVGQYFAEKLGPSGLIQGQMKDLSGEMNANFTELMETHRLKTANLLQVSLLGGHLLALGEDADQAQEFPSIERLGVSLGILFQLLDDLQELATEKALEGHEKAINPWPHKQTFHQCAQSCTEHLERVNSLLENRGKMLTQTLNSYFTKVQNKLNKHETLIDEKLPPGKSVSENLRPLMTGLNRLC